MSARPESRKELRLEGRGRRGPVSGNSFTPKAKTACGELKVESDQPLIVVTRNPGRQKLLSKLDRCSECELFFVENLPDSRDVVYLAVAVIEEAIAIEGTYEILQIFESRGRK